MQYQLDSLLHAEIPSSLIRVQLRDIHTAVDRIESLLGSNRILLTSLLNITTARLGWVNRETVSGSVVVFVNATQLMQSHM